MTHIVQHPASISGTPVRVIDGGNVGVRQGASTVVTSWCDVISVKSEKKRTWIYTTRGALKSSGGLTDIVDALSPLGLVRVHRGLAVNAGRVRRLVGHGRHRVTLLLDTGDEFPVGRQFQRTVRSRFGFAKPASVAVQS